MWMAPEDAHRYQELAGFLEGILREDAVLRGEQRVDPEDLALYLEWLELAREMAANVRPFIDKSSPFALSTLTYRQMQSDFRWLQDRVGALAGEMVAAGT
jgi:hypothetical protein